MAEAFVARAEAAVEQLATFPESGRLAPEFRQRIVRELIVQSYRVFHRIRSGDVEVLSVVHGARQVRDSDVPLQDGA